MNASWDDEIEERTYADAKAFVRDVLAEAGHIDISSSLSYPGTATSVANELLAAVRMLDGTVDSGGESIELADFPEARALAPGTRLHVRLKRASWQTFLAVTAMVGSILITGGVAAPLWTTSVGLLGVLKANSKKLTPNEKVVYLGVAALYKANGDKPLSRSRVLKAIPKDAKGEAWREGALLETMQRLARQSVLAESEQGYAPVL